MLSLIVLITLVIVVFFGLGLYSETGAPLGLANGQLAPCPNKPNCVSSESSPSDDHSIAALPITPGMGEEPLLKVKEVIELLGGDVNFPMINTWQAHSQVTFLALSMMLSFVWIKAAVCSMCDQLRGLGTATWTRTENV